MKKLTLILLFLPILIFGQITYIVGNGNFGVVASTTQTVSVGNTSGANFIVVGVGTYAATGAMATSVGDNYSNTYTRAFRAFYPGYENTDVWYAYNATGGSGHICTVTFGASSANTVGVGAFSGVKSTSNPIEYMATSSSLTTNVNTITPGPITPSTNNNLIVAIVTFSSLAPTIAAPTGYSTIYRNPAGTLNTSLQFVYKIQTTLATENPVFQTVTGSNTACAGIVNFLSNPIISGNYKGIILFYSR